jgi:LemA protein
LSPRLTLLLIAAVLTFWMLGAYNRLVRLRNVIATVFQGFALQALERTGLVSRLSDLAREHMAERDDLIEAAVQADKALSRALEAARLKPVQPRTVAELGRCDHALALSLDALCASLREHVGYVDTQFDPEVQHPVIIVLERLAGVLEQTDFARLTYNQAVGDYNAAIRQFPSTVVAALFGFKAAALLPEVPRSAG